MWNIERMKDQLVQWGLLDEVWALKDAGYSLTDAIYFVYKAHTAGRTGFPGTLKATA